MQSLSKCASTDALCSKIPGLPHKSISYSAEEPCGKNRRIGYDSGVDPEFRASGHQSMNNTRGSLLSGLCSQTASIYGKQPRAQGMCLSPVGPTYYTHIPPQSQVFSESWMYLLIKADLVWLQDVIFSIVQGIFSPCDKLHTPLALQLMPGEMVREQGTSVIYTWN